MNKKTKVEKDLIMLLKKGNIIDKQAANALIKAGDEKVILISDERIKATNELIKIQRKRKDVFLVHNHPITKKNKR